MTNPVYDEIKQYFSDDERVVVNAGKGAQGIKFKGKMFCMFSKGDLMLQFPEEKVEQLVTDGTGIAVTYAKNRVIIPVESQDLWIELTEKALKILEDI